MRRPWTGTGPPLLTSAWEESVLVGVHGRPTRRSDWRVHPPARTVDVLPTPTMYPWRMWPSVYFGVFPEAMEDKWFAYMENRRLRIHRSWTGHPIWEVSFILSPEGFQCGRLRVVNDPDVYERGTDLREAHMADWFVWHHFGTAEEDGRQAERSWDTAMRA